MLGDHLEDGAVKAVEAARQAALTRDPDRAVSDVDEPACRALDDAEAGDVRTGIHAEHAKTGVVGCDGRSRANPAETRLGWMGPLERAAGGTRAETA